jgi:hypothetical protein
VPPLACRPERLRAGAPAPQGVALKCVCCKTLLLNPTNFQQHLESKRHQAKLHSWPQASDDAIRLARGTSNKFEVRGLGGSWGGGAHCWVEGA